MRNMKLTLFAVCALIPIFSAKAQDLYDANRFIGNELNGTARFVGMGGAMGALGGDISTIGTNPAGIGIYRSNDIMMSFGLNSTTANSDFSGMSMGTSKVRPSYDNAGFIYSNKIGNNTPLRYVNFGFNYRKVKNFNREMSMGGNLDGLSQTDQMAIQANGLTANDFAGKGSNGSFDPWGDPSIGWLSLLGKYSELIWPNKEVAPNESVDYNGFEGNDPYADYSSVEKGSIQAYDFNIAFNFLDRVYLGFTIGAYNVDYSRQSYYREGFDPLNGIDGSFYTLDNWFKTTGAGVDFKLGLIVRPIETSPLRIGVAVHSPTFYNLRNTTSALLMSDLDLNYDGQVSREEQFTVDTQQEAGDAITDFRLITPWKYNFSLGYTFGQYVALGAEYEYEDYSTAKLKRDIDGYTENMDYENSTIKNSLKGVHTFRVGTEIKPIHQFAVRFGYNHSTASIEDNAYKVIPYDGPNSIRTDTEYANTKAMNNYTVGMGYKGSMFYADLAYQYSAYKENFYPFDDERLAPAKIDNYRSQVLLTLGVRF